MAAHTSQALDPARVVHLSGRYAPVTDEVDEAGLQVVGELPDELDGLFLRNGPNPRFSPIGSFLYPIDGDGMLHGVRISGGQARYRNRFVRTPAVLAEERAGPALWGGIESMITPQAPDVTPELADTLRDLPNINVVRHAGRLLALAESDCPFLVTPELETAGKETFGGALPAGITAHPKTDPATGEMLVFCYGLEPPCLTWSAIDPTGSVARGPTAVDGLDAPMMIHDMALTARFLVLVLAPVFFDIAAVMSGGSLIDWRPERGTRVALVPRDGGPVRWASDEAFWLWHTVNAYDTEPAGGEVVLDYVQWSRLSMGVPDPTGRPNTAGLVRAVIDPAAGTMHRTVLDDARMELPRTDDRLIGRRHQQLAVAADSGDPDLLPGEFDALRWYDGRDASGTSVVWRAGDLSVGEPVFAPSPGSTSGAGGHWMTYATDRTDDSSWLLVIPADDPASGPVARVRIPVRVPLGLHGNWLPTQE
ncbi:carotenoid oxygenase family protein [Streptomyces sp. NPDC005426]|uniref:carotenoid oxygenase family protein n=1 Tax=Streptomyces sp. NPDC005426 TaxID=3155344 RepID=UPI0033A1C982